MFQDLRVTQCLKGRYQAALQYPHITASKIPKYSSTTDLLKQALSAQEPIENTLAKSFLDTLRLVPPLVPPGTCIMHLCPFHTTCCSISPRLPELDAARSDSSR